MTAFQVKKKVWPPGCCPLEVCGGGAVVFRCSRDLFTIFSIAGVKYACDSHRDFHPPPRHAPRSLIEPPAR
jgi:hypothetical protein